MRAPPLAVRAFPAGGGGGRGRGPPGSSLPLWDGVSVGKGSAAHTALSTSILLEQLVDVERAQAGRLGHTWFKPPPPNQKQPLYISNPPTIRDCQPNTGL